MWHHKASRSGSASRAKTQRPINRGASLLSATLSLARMTVQFPVTFWKSGSNANVSCQTSSRTTVPDAPPNTAAQQASARARCARTWNGATHRGATAAKLQPASARPRGRCAETAAPRRATLLHAMRCPLRAAASVSTRRVRGIGPRRCARVSNTQTLRNSSPAAFLPPYTTSLPWEYVAVCPVRGGGDTCDALSHRHAHLSSAGEAMLLSAHRKTEALLCCEHLRCTPTRPALQARRLEARRRTAPPCRCL